MESDKPVVDRSADRFQRYNFAKRIAETILSQTQKHSLTIGLYGQWGEGKTSVIEFVNRELDQKAITVRFNPWQLAGENTLLMAFFITLADAIDAKLFSWGDKVAKSIKAYGGLVTVGKLVPKEAVESLGNAFSQASISSHHKVIVEALSKAEQPIVVFIDDIDRLDSAEIQSIFKLVKAVADFPNITYVLAFDQVRVVDALKGVFGDGYAYLEKIIQVPLTLPKAQPSALRMYTYDLVNQATSQSGILITGGESSFFRNCFEKYLAQFITTPRDSARISNAIRFALPMLNGEAHMGDLMLIETIKVLQPALYQSIRNSPNAYLRVYDSLGVDRTVSDEDKKQAKALVESHLTSLSSSERTDVMALLNELFPQLKTLYRNISYGGDSHYKKWHQQKRLCSSSYFDRYFTYVVINGQISDVQFDRLLVSLSKKEINTALSCLEEILATTEAREFLFKIKFFEGSYSLDQAAQFAKLLAIAGDHFFIQDDVIFSTAVQSADIIKSFIELQPEQYRADLAMEIISMITPLSLALVLHEVLRRENNHEGTPPVLTSQTMFSWEELLFHRLLTEIGTLDLFTNFDEDSLRRLFRVWIEHDVKDLLKRTDELLESYPKYGLTLLKIMSGTTIRFGGSKSEIFKSPISDDDFKVLRTIANVGKLYESTLKQYGRHVNSYMKIKSGDDPIRLSDMELLGNFQEIAEQSQPHYFE